jgi:hypothetical protein
MGLDARRRSHGRRSAAGGNPLKVKRDMDKATNSTPRVDALAERQKWIEFASRLLNLCVEIQRTCDIRITEKEFAEPKILALALLARTYMNMKGVIAVAKEGLVVEARTLARSCFENLFLVPNLIEKGDEFVKAMYDHERRSVRSQGEFLLEDLDDLDPFAAEMATRLRARLREIKDLSPNAKLLHVKDVASGTVLKRAYLFYSQFSTDAAHPTIRALKRHLLQTVENGERVLGLDIHPVERGAEVADTVNIACNAVLGVCVAVNQILGGTAANQLLNSLFAEYGAMNGTARAENS